MKKILITFFYLLFLNLSGQNFFNDVSINLGVGISKPDDRYGKSITGPPGILAYVTNKDNYTNDNWYFVSIDKGIYLGKEFNLRIGLGYQQYISDYPNYVNNLYFDDFTYRIFLIGGYKNQMISNTHSVEKTFLDKKLVFGFHLNNNMGFKKSLYTSAEKFGNSLVYSRNKTKIVYQGFEFLPYLKYNFNNISALVSIRAFHLKLRDEAIESAEQKVDTFNPMKVNFTLCYNIKMIKK